METAEPRQTEVNSGPFFVIASGSLWFGILAFALELLIVVAFVFDWNHVIQRQPVFEDDKMVGWTEKKLRRMELHTNYQNGSGTAFMPTIIVRLAYPLAILGFFLAILAWFLPRKSSRLLLVGFWLNFSNLVVPFVLAALTMI